MLIFRLRRRVLLPTIWLREGEWRHRFRRDNDALMDVLDQSAATVLEDLGGFRSLIEGVRWVSSATKACRDCGRELAITEFRIQGRAIRPECHSCEQRKLVAARDAKGVGLRA